MSIHREFKPVIPLEEVLVLKNILQRINDVSYNIINEGHTEEFLAKLLKDLRKNQVDLDNFINSLLEPDDSEPEAQA